MDFKELVFTTRSVRRFRQDRAVPMSLLEELADLAAHTASAGNLQPLKYVLCNDPAVNARIFPCLGWAAYLKDWPGPEEGERPAAYVVVLGDHGITNNFHCDHGIAVQTIMLGAREKGLGGCIIGTVNRKVLKEELDLGMQYEVLLVLALGEPAERVVLEKVDSGGDIGYWRDEQGAHHVPKRGPDQVVLARFTPENTCARTTDS